MKVQIDFVIREGESPEQALQIMTSGFDGLEATVTAESGPGGGNPQAEVSGPVETVWGFLDLHGYGAGEYHVID